MSVKPFVALTLATATLAACGSSTPQIDPSTRASSDPIVLSVASIFRNACVRNAPDFAEAQVRAAMQTQQPVLGPGMSFAATGKDGKSCEVIVRNYGRDRPMPTVGDVNGLARSLQAEIGGDLRPKSADADAGSARVKADRKTYNVYGYVGKSGDLRFVVHR